ncbi:MAG: penicillin-binding protein 1C [candidate division Zixibacteria bacterium]|nr:penicillin-binding protein 1C [candidate division Zixibacteria bacterium]MBU1470438.1 penicillin-binding protein 1C [candidate division Zixibacteria bacterium]MBU2625887.1 penicillin-binding protein 1C [candidate division Zixibacteria bacterium]
MRNRIMARIAAVVLIPVFVCLILNWIFPLPTDKLYPQASTVVLDRNGEVMRVFLAPDGMWRIPVGLQEMSPTLTEAALTYEDKHFYWHPGVNPASIIRAAYVDLRAGRFVQGGSTITMQVARMIEPKERTIAGKVIEVLRSFQLELHYSKDEILACYLNLAPYGGNIVGVGAASMAYFNKLPNQLSLGEAAILAAIPNSPNNLRPDLNPENAAIARKKVLGILGSQKLITETRLAEALSEDIPDRRYQMPFEIPHLSNMLVASYPQMDRIESTIDGKIQNLAERVLSMNLEPLEAVGITNGSVVIIDNHTSDVLALVGSGDFTDDEAQGQVNGATALRSPGSALKPFVYALGLDRGLISPRGLLYDVPINYAGYSPENYDGVYNGCVTVTDALVRSLNVPAVRLTADLRHDGIYEFLRAAGVTSLTREREYYGLSITLGGCEVSLLELTNLYSGMARGGKFARYRFLRSETPVAGERLISSEASFIISEILSQLRRPELPSVWDWSVDMPKVAWKTGTSYGRRDAWSIGYTPRFTVGVWVGNFDGKGVPELVGAESAAPILFSIFTALHEYDDGGWFVEPRGVERRQVCSVSGMPMSENCVSACTEMYIPGVSPFRKCNIHEKILVDKKENVRLCSHCRADRDCEERIVEQWPADVAIWLERTGHAVEKIPEHYPQCPVVVAGDAPIILSPMAEAEYKIRTGVDLSYQNILLDASVSNRTRKIFWFVDRELVYSGTPMQRVFINPEPGKHSVVCTDDEGRSSEIKFVVR